MLTIQWRVRLRRTMLRAELLFLAGALGLSVAGCTVGPDFKVPDALAVSRYTFPDEPLQSKRAGPWRTGGPEHCDRRKSFR